MQTTNSLRARILGMYLGKAAGGTLGQPWEGCTGPLSLSYYDPVPKGMVPNDDLDLQVIRACLLAGSWNQVLSYANMRDAWVGKIDFPCDEYGVAIRNFKLGIPAPWTGRYDNAFCDGLGGAIRSELFAALAPGNPKLAARMAELDGSVDHCGEGVYAEVFLAALESAVLGGAELSSAFEAGIAAIPDSSRLRRAVCDTRKWCKNGTFESVRKEILAKYDSDNFTDVVMNISFMVMALELSCGDFGKAITLAVNCGRDADCTGASVGAIIGALNPDGIPAEWLKPIGRELVISKGYYAENPPATLDEFAELVLSLQGKVILDETVAPEPDWSKFTIPLRSSVFSPYFLLDSNKFNPSAKIWNEMIVPGNLFEVDFSMLAPETLLLLEADFVNDAERTVRVAVNTPAYSRVWLDGEDLFSREGGSFVPAFHRTPLNQGKKLRLSAGKHTLRIGLAPTRQYPEHAPLLFGVSTENCQWLPMFHSFSMEH